MVQSHPRWVQGGWVGLWGHGVGPGRRLGGESAGPSHVVRPFTPRAQPGPLGANHLVQRGEEQVHEQVKVHRPLWASVQTEREATRRARSARPSQPGSPVSPAQSTRQPGQPGSRADLRPPVATARWRGGAAVN